MKKTILFGIMFLLMMVVVKAEICYQGLPNVLTSCGGIAGESPIAGVQGGTLPTSYELLFNYTKPTHSHSMLWEVNHGWNDSTNTSFFYNATIPDSCWNAYPDNVILLMRTFADCYSDNSYPQCWNGTNRINVGIVSSGSHGLSCPYSGGGADWGYDVNYSTCTFAYNQYPNYVWSKYMPSCVGYDVTTQYARFFEQAVYWDISCVESWTAQSSSCVSGYYIKTYIDENNCGTTNDLPSDNGTSINCYTSTDGAGSGSSFNSYIYTETIQEKQEIIVVETTPEQPILEKTLSNAGSSISSVGTSITTFFTSIFSNLQMIFKK